LTEQPGDKVMKISASFGDDVWEAKNYGQVIYAIRTRNGQVYLNIKRNYGSMSAMEVGAPLRCFFSVPNEPATPLMVIWMHNFPHTLP
jgi:hypothetical protein